MLKILWTIVLWYFVKIVLIMFIRSCLQPPEPVLTLTSCFFKRHFNIILKSIHTSLKWSFYFRLSDWNFYSFLIFLIHITCLFHLIFLNMWWRVQIMNFLIMYISLSLCYCSYVIILCMVYLMMLSVTQATKGQMALRSVNKTCERMRKEAVVAWFEVLIKEFAWRNWGKPWKASQ
jgi:hypothetical protein